MENPSTPNAVWIAAAELLKNNPDRIAFRVSEIIEKIKRLNIQGNVTDATVRTHISSHCVANRPPRPDTHRKLVKLAQGMYRLYIDGDYYDEGRRNGQTVPLPDMIPQRFRHLIDWYYNEYVKSKLVRVGRDGSPVHLPKPIKNFAKEGVDFVETQHLDPKSVEFTSIDSNNMIRIPEKIMQALNLEIGDHVGFILDGDRLIVKKQ